MNEQLNPLPSLPPPPAVEAAQPASQAPASSPQVTPATAAPVTPPPAVPPRRIDKVVAIRLRQTGKLDYFDAAGVPFNSGDTLVLETAHGPELGTAAAALRDPTAEESAKGLKPVLRRATTDDVERYQKWEGKSGEAVARGRELAQKLNLAMKPIAARYNLDGSHLTIYFTAGERIDFRDLVRELRQALHTRVELRQVGPRDEAKLIGAVGKCGRHLCCMTFINEFQPISIRMAKDQDLSLSPMKVSGVCGRLLCCLGYEAEQYRTLRERSPRVGQEASSPSGKGKVVSLNPLKETVMLEIGTESAVEVPISQLTWEKKPRMQPEGQPEVANQGRQGGDRRKFHGRDQRRRGENRPPDKPAVAAEPVKPAEVSGCDGCQACQPVPPGEAPPAS